MTEQAHGARHGAPRNTLRIDGDTLTVIPRGFDRFWGFRNRIDVPLARITRVRVHPGTRGLTLGWRGPGLDTGRKRVGTFHPGGERTYWNTSGPGAVLEVVVAGGTPFHRLYLSVADPETQRSAIAAAAGLD